MKKIIILASLSLLSHVSISQVTLKRQRIEKLKNDHVLLNDSETFPTIDFSSYPLEDLIEEAKNQNNNLPKQFGVALETSIEFSHGAWSLLDDTTKIWRIAILSKGAKSLNVHFD